MTESEAVNWINGSMKMFPEPMKKYFTWLKYNAELFTDVDKEYSKKMAKHYSSEKSHCFSNCISIHAKEPELRYYEGMVIFDDYPIMDHAWLVKDEIVYDPTYAINESKFGLEYFGIKIPKKILHMEDNSARTPLHRYYHYHIELEERKKNGYWCLFCGKDGESFNTTEELFHHMKNTIHKDSDGNIILHMDYGG